MKKSRIKSAILVFLTIVVILSLVGCVKLQKKAPKEDTNEDEPDMSSVDKEAEKVKDEVDEVDEMTDEADEVDEMDKEMEETDEEEKEEEPAPVADTSGLPIKTVTEGDLVSFPNLKAEDPDGDPITYTFSAPLDTSGQWKTQEGDAGEYVITITASDGKNEVSQNVKIIVETLNKAPTITLSATEITVNEGETVKIDAQASDADGDEVTLTFSGWMDSPTRETTFDDEGRHTVTITATDGKKESVQDVTVIVNNVNRAPKLSDLSDITVLEGEKIFVEVDAADPDGDEVTILFEAPLGTSGEWKTEPGDAGTYQTEVTVSDGELTETKTLTLIVESLNKAPVIDLALPTINVEEGETVVIEATITDEENDELTITYSGWITSNTYTTDYDDAGTHTVTITVTDGTNTVTKDVTVNVVDKNRPPVFDPGAFN
jgi:hypothetical protein